MQIHEQSILWLSVRISNDCKVIWNEVGVHFVNEEMKRDKEEMGFQAK
jgi:hypothetical protein